MANGSRARNPAGSATLLTVVIVVAVLYFARSVFIPFALAILLSFLLAPLVIRLRHWGLGRGLAAVLVVLLSVCLLVVTGFVMTSQLADLAHKMPEYEQNIRNKMDSIRSSGGGLVRRFTREVRTFTDELMPPMAGPTRTRPGEQQPVPVEIRRTPFAPLETVQKVLGSVFNIMLVASIVIVFVVFMLIQREDLRDRLLRLVGEGRLNVTTQALDEAAHRLSRYLLAQLFVNAGYGLAVGVALYFTGVPNPLLWGILAALLRYIPYLGIWIAAAMPAMVAFAVEPGWIKVPIIFGLYFGIDLLNYNFVEPVLYGSSTGISPMAVLVAAVFWTWLWGPVGLLLAMPLTVCVVVLGRYVPSLEFLSVILSDEPVLAPPARFYQRMLAMDLQEATEVADEFLKGKSLEELYDEVIIPALSLAEEDRHRGKMDEARQQFIFHNTRLLIERLAGGGQELAAQSSESDAAALANESEKTPSTQPSAPPTVLCIPARDQADEIAAQMLIQLLNKRGITGKALSLGALASECLEEVRREKPRVTCVFAVPPFGYMHARYLCRRLRSQFPQFKLIGAVLTERDADELKKRQPTVPADHLAPSLRETLSGVLSFITVKTQPATEPVLTPSQ